MVPADVIGVGQVGDRTGDLEDAIEAARTEGESLCRCLEQPAPVAAEGRVTPKQPALEVGVDAGGCVPTRRAVCRARAAMTRRRISAELSATATSVSIVTGTAGTSMTRSSRSRNGPDSRPR